MLCMFLKKISNYLRLFTTPRKQINSSLFARFSHEMRTHLTGIVGYAEFLEERENESMVAFTAKIIRESSINLTQTNNAYCDLIYLLNTEMKLSCSRFIFYELINTIIKNYQIVGFEREVNMGASCDQAISQKSVSTDFARLQQALEALVNGTLQMLEKWSSLHLHLDRNLIGDTWILNLEFSKIAVNSSQMKLYEEFWTNSKYEFRLQEGPGVILAMAKEMLFFMGSEITFQRDSNSGEARLIITLPFN